MCDAKGEQGRMLQGWNHLGERPIVQPFLCRHSSKGALTYLLSSAQADIRTVQELLGHYDVKTTMLYIRVLHRGQGSAVRWTRCESI